MFLPTISLLKILNICLNVRKTQKKTYNQVVIWQTNILNNHIF